MAHINDLNINISLLTTPLQQAGFGTPLILGKRTLTESTPAAATGDADLSLGHDWSGGNAKTLSLKVNDEDAAILSLDADCDTLEEVLALINAKILAAGLDELAEAVASGNYVKLQTIGTGSGESLVLAEGDGALAQLGIDAGSYAGTSGTDKIIGIYNEFADAASMIEAGFSTSDPEYVMAGKMFGQSPSPEKVAVYIRSAIDSITAALASLLLTHNDWYALLITERDKTSLHEAGDAALANEKLFFGCTSDLTALTGRNNIREVYLIHDDPASYPEAAWVGQCLPKDIGSYTWKWKRPTGVSASGFTLTQLNTIRAGNGQTFSERSGVVYADNGITTGGEFIDVIQSRDYIKARLGEDLFGLEIRSDKIAFDNTGFARFEATIRSRLKQCGDQGIIARVTTEEDLEKSDEGVYMYTLDMPERSDIPDNDRAARILSGVSFELVIAGAIHKTAISGVITV